MPSPSPHSLPGEAVFLLSSPETVLSPTRLYSSIYVSSATDVLTLDVTSNSRLGYHVSDEEDVGHRGPTRHAVFTASVTICATIR